MKINKIIFVIIFAVLFYVIIAVYSDFSLFLQEIKNVNFELLPVILILITLSIIIKGIRQYYILKILKIDVPLGYNIRLFISGLSMLITPAGSGTAIKSQFLKDEFGISRSKTIPFAFVERYHDFIAIVVILFITLSIVQSFATQIISYFSAGFLTSIFFIINQKKILFWCQKKFEKIKFLKKIFIKDDEFYDSLFILFNLKNTIFLSGFTIPIIAIESIAIFLAFMSVIPEINPVDSIQNFFTAVLAGLFSFIPAGLGVTELSMVELFSKFELEISKVVSAVLYVRLVTLWFMTLLGFIFLKTMYNKKNY